MMCRSSSQILFKHLFGVLLQVAGEQTLTMSHLVILEQLAGPDDRCAWPRFVQVSASPWRRVCRATLTINFCWDLIDVDVDSEAESSPSSPVAKRHKLWAST